MAGFSVRDAALEGFRLTRENPLLAVALALFYAVVFLAVVALAVQSGALVELAALKWTAQPPPEQYQPLFNRLITAVAKAFPLILVISVITETAIVRLVLDPAQRTAGGVRVGLDELRVFFVRLVLIILGNLVQLLGTVLLAGLGRVAGLANLLALLILAATVVIAVRFSMAVPMTFATRRIALLQSLTLTKGRTLPILGAVSLAFLFNLLVTVLGAFMTMAIMAATGGWTALSKSTELTVLLNPGVLILVAVMAIFQALANIIQIAPSAYIYRALTRSEAQV